MILKFFVDMLKLRFRSGNKDDTNSEASLRAYKFLSKIKILPGQSLNSFDAKKFRTWFFKAREKCIESKLEREFYSTFGRILSYAPFDDIDKCWPHQSVREIIEKFPDDYFKSALRCGLFNKRGVVAKSCFEGGSKERSLADKYKNWAEKIQFLWPETASILENLAMQYDQIAEGEDVRVDFDRIKDC